jgi:hypothetical protein
MLAYFVTNILHSACNIVCSAHCVLSFYSRKLLVTLAPELMKT